MLSIEKYRKLCKINTFESPWSSRQCVGLLDEKPGFDPRPDIKTKYEKYFFRDFLLADFWQKTLRVNKICHEKFL